MPYVKQEAKDRLDPKINQLANVIETGGELNYAITRLAIIQVKKFGNVSYSSLSEVYGHLSCAAAEFYRRALAPYEDEKKEENGDVYEELE